MLSPFRSRCEDSKRKRLEILDDDGEMKLVSRTGKPPEPHALKVMVALQMS
jgi:hypothetical protein